MRRRNGEDGNVIGNPQNGVLRMKTLSTYVLCGCLALVGLGGVSAQTPTAETQAVPVTPRVSVPLVSDTCPAARPGQSISLDWNPGFDHAGVVTGLRLLRLRFGRLVTDGVQLNMVTPLVMGGLGHGFSAVATANGYFHLEVTLPRSLAAGEYHLFDATALAATLPEYQGPAIRMTNSPADARLCFTVATASRS